MQYADDLERDKVIGNGAVWYVTRRLVYRQYAYQTWSV